jgi:hypothetical protein
MEISLWVISSPIEIKKSYQNDKHRQETRRSFSFVVKNIIKTIDVPLDFITKPVKYFAEIRTFF